MDFILKNIQRENYILLNGRSYVGKSTLSKKLKEELKAFHVSLTCSKSIKSLISISIFNKYNTVTFFVEEKPIEIYLSEKRIVPNPKSQKYIDIFKHDKYAMKEKSLAYKNNVIIIDDCHLVKIEYLSALIEGISMVLPDTKFILLGNSHERVSYHNIFTVSIFKKNLNSRFIQKELTHKTKFIKTFPFLLTYEKLYMTEYRESIGLSVMFYIKERDVEVYEVTKINKLHISCDYDIIDSYNNKFLPDLSKQYIFEPIHNLSDYSDTFVEMFSGYYYFQLKKRILFLGAKIIHEGEIGYIRSIRGKEVTIVINGCEKVITYVTITNRESGIKFDYLPLTLAYCIHYRELEPRDEGVMVLSYPMSLNFFETCFNKIKSLYFRNTGLINCLNLFSVSYIQEQSDKVK